MLGKWKTYQQRTTDLHEARCNIETQQISAHEELIMRQEQPKSRHQRGDTLSDLETAETLEALEQEIFINVQQIVCLYQRLLEIVQQLLTQGGAGGPDQPELHQGMGAAAAPLPQHQAPGAAADLQPNPEDENTTIIAQQALPAEFSMPAPFWSSTKREQTKK